MILPHDRTLKDFLDFRSARGCYASSGRAGGAQIVGLSPQCAEEQILIHEVHLNNLQQFLVVLYKQ